MRSVRKLLSLEPMLHASTGRGRARSFVRALGLAAACVAIAGCPAETAPGTDGGSSLDTGPNVDVGPELDAASSLDAPDAAPGSCTTDADGDGDPSIPCGGTDCDDTNERRAPSRTEICDAADLDEDCDPTTFGVRDLDMDGEADAACCNGAGTELVCGEDCDDTRASVSPLSPEVCNGRDDDCDTHTDEGVLETFYVDTDHDQFGVASLPTLEACAAPIGYADDAGDCDDEESGVNPGVMERCDAAMVDENCDGVANPSAACTCSDGASRGCTAPGACAAGREICAGGAWGPCSIGPMAETCNGIDDDCSGAVDEGVTVTCYADIDDDTYAPAGAVSVARCAVAGRPAVGGCAIGYTNRAPGLAPDCNDALIGVSPGATELCDRLDSNCSSGGGVALDEDADGDLHAPPAAGCSGGYPRDDCDDAVSTTHGGATELCNRVDDDCSSGGGVATEEDADGDGHAPVGAACSGGSLPETDCHDGNADVFGGQIRYFEAPYCLDGTTPHVCPGESSLFCGEGACPSSGPVALATYDYDCSGSVTKMEVHACPSTGGGMCPAATACRSGPYSNGAACGVMTTFRICNCGGSSCARLADADRRMACH